MGKLTGNASNIEMHQLLTAILENAFPGQTHPIEKLCQFYVEFHRKEGTKDGDYQADYKKIRINNLSREANQILITALHDLAHHIEMTFFGETAHKERFYSYYHNLLVTAMGMKLLNLFDIRNMEEKQLEKLQKNHGLLGYWKIPQFTYKKGQFYIDVSRGWSNRETLKCWGYRYLPLEEIWRAEFHESVVWHEKAELVESGVLEKNIMVYPANQFEFSAMYYLVIRNAFDHRQVLTQLGYRYGRWNVGKRNWIKKIPAHQLECELEKVAGLMGVKVNVLKEMPSS
ncbi:hypothetical protein [Listeria goaensis]|uniref:hypothetical protein n=1 Tax=Listeria goaensis TaxID=1649188 RepID=UPI000B58B2ED|nr:hypothetical protein [Listeria goaensis]